MKYSSAYLSPQFIGVSKEGASFVKSPSEVAWRTEDGVVVYEPVYASAAHDAWSLGVILFELFSGTTLFHSDFRDNISQQEQLMELYTFTSAYKAKKLADIKDPLARNLVSQLLHKDANQRTPLKNLVSHPFLSGKTSAVRLLGEKAEFAVFISYRVDSDADMAKALYDRLTAAGVTVWWDKACLLPGESWEVPSIYFMHATLLAK